MDEHTLGELAYCKDCGHEIEYIGPYWRHVHSSPRHVANPGDFFAKGRSVDDNATTINQLSAAALKAECRRLEAVNAELLAACEATRIALCNFRAAVVSRDAIVPGWVGQEIDRLTAAIAKARGNDGKVLR